MPCWRPFILSSSSDRLRPRPLTLPFYSSLFSMLAARASAARSASRIARSARRFATVVDSAGVKVAAADNGEPTTAVTFLVKAGSRYEPKPGVAHALKNYAFKVCARANFWLRGRRGNDGFPDDLRNRAPTSVRRWALFGRRSCMVVCFRQAFRGSTSRSRRSSCAATSECTVCHVMQSLHRHILSLRSISRMR